MLAESWFVGVSNPFLNLQPEGRLKILDVQGLNSLAYCGEMAGQPVGSLLRAEGLAQVRYVATMSSFSVTLHAVRLGAYGIGGAVEPDMIAKGLALAVAIALGNLLGDRVRRWLGDNVQQRVQHATLLTMLSLAIGAVLA